MSVKEEKYVLYDYLKFIWNKKMFVILGLIAGLIIGGVYAMTRPVTYTGTALVFTGNAENDMLTKKELIRPKYQDEIPPHLGGSFTVNIPSDFQVTLSVTGSDRNEVESNINHVSELYVKDLDEGFTRQYDAIEGYSSALSGSIEKTEALLDLYNEKLLTASPTDSNVYQEEIMKLERQLEKDKENRAENEIDKSIMERPELMTVNMSVNDTSVLLYSLLAGAGLLQAVLVLLVLWKYLRDAAREY